MIEEKSTQSDPVAHSASPAPLFIPAREKTDIYADGHLFRTCAYCRVSTDSDMQLSSFEIQTEHYKNLVGKHPNWDLKRIYADEGISGTSLKNRDEFNEMMSACWRGEYDLIVTKSVSRFARNLVDCISLVRRLKNHNPPIGVFFETDNLFTLSEDSELKLSLLATFAQEESVKKSESMVWSLHERFKTGKLLTPELYGYSRARDASGRYIKGAKLEIVEEEAEVVRFIFDAFLAGYPMASIAEILTASNVPTKTGKNEWNAGALSYILHNERYCGSVLTWKTFTADIFEHKKRKNNQDRDQYLYTEDHSAIISVEKFEAVQTLMENKRHHVKKMPVMHVIDDGIFRGYVPINHHWVNDSAAAYYEASNSVTASTKLQRLQKRYFSVFDLDGYQVVRGQFLTRRAECPSLTISDKRISFNVECIRRFSDVDYVQLLIHPSERKLAIRPCEERDVHSIRWNTGSNKPPTSKQLCCQFFSTCLYEIMGWNPDFDYNIRGTWLSNGQDEIIVFDVTQAMPIAVVDRKDKQTDRTRKVRVPCIPEEWEESFGDEFYDFSVQNGLYYISSRLDWKAQAKSHAVACGGQPHMISEEELQMSMARIRMRAGAVNG